MKRLAALVLFLLSGCASTHDYLHDRGADLVDVLRVHLIGGQAIGVEVQATQWLGLGFMYEKDAWAGGLHNRALGTWHETVKAWGLLIHDWRESTKGIPSYSGSYGWYQKNQQGGPSFSSTTDTIDIWTVRGSFALLFGADVELRVGEVVDFVVGIFTWDPAGDDG
jgi:hypothetical protein